MKLKISFIGKFLFAISLLFALSCQTPKEKQDAKLSFGISFSEELSKEALDGRVLLMISKNNENEPRNQINDGAKTQQIFGIDVEGLKPGENAEIDASVFGYPLESISNIETGEYWVQGLINRYETFTRSDGHTVKLPPDKGEGQKWNRKPGNLYSTPQKVTIDPKCNELIEITLDQEIPIIEDPETTKYIKHVKIESKLLSEFWGRPMFLGAHVLIPEGFDEHPEAKYPLMVYRHI